MQTISFNNRNAFLGLGTITVYIIAYFSQVLLAAVFKIISMIYQDKWTKNKVYEYLIKGLFFNTILTITMEGFIEFVVLGFLNIYTIDYSTNGEVLGMVFAFICIFLSFFLISVQIWSITLKDET